MPYFLAIKIRNQVWPNCSFDCETSKPCGTCCTIRQIDNEFIIKYVVFNLVSDSLNCIFHHRHKITMSKFCDYS